MKADDGSSRRARHAKRRIALRELKETSFRLRVMRETGILTAAHDPVITECAELVKILATIIRKSKDQLPTIQRSNDPTIQRKPFEQQGEMRANKLVGAAFTPLARMTLLGSLDRWIVGTCQWLCLG